MARLLEASLMRHCHALLSAKLSALTHPLGASLLILFGGPFAVPFTLLHGAGTGILTIARGTVPLALFGPENYGLRLGLLGAPARIAQAAAPLLFGFRIESYQADVLVLSSVMCLAASMALSLARSRRERPSPPGSSSLEPVHQGPALQEVETLP
jgi:hypothetical protein